MLKSLILPYQCEVLAGELDYRLNPFMPYQVVGSSLTREEFIALATKTPYKVTVMKQMYSIMKHHGFAMDSMESVASWIEECLVATILNGAKNPTLQIADENKTVFLTLSPGSITLHPEDFSDVVGVGNDRRNCFGIVTCPLYPEKFGRYSDNVTITLSRMKDFTALPSEQRRKIRHDCNSIYQAHGVRIENLEEDKQPDGVWIPEYVVNSLEASQH